MFSFPLSDLCFAVLDVYTADLNEQKFSSNVVEKCLQMASEDLRDVLIRELCSDDAIGRMLQDQYGTS